MFFNKTHQLQKSRRSSPPVSQRERRSMGRNLRSRSSRWQQTVETAQCLLWMSWRPQWGRLRSLLLLWLVSQLCFTELMSHSNIHIQILRWFPLFFCLFPHTEKESGKQVFLHFLRPLKMLIRIAIYLLVLDDIGYIIVHIHIHCLYI